jgi:hypothetical protein
MRTGKSTTPLVLAVGAEFFSKAILSKDTEERQEALKETEGAGTVQRDLNVLASQSRDDRKVPAHVSGCRRAADRLWKEIKRRVAEQRGRRARGFPSG